MHKIYMVSLGCDKNLVDSEMMLSLISEHPEYAITEDEFEADVIIVNTCCFIGDAKEESIQTIIDMGQLKCDGSCKALIVSGCLAQRYTDEIRDQLPEVDAIVGTLSISEIDRAIKECLSGQKNTYKLDINTPPLSHRQMVSTGGHYAYLKIAEGCDKHCTYCVIPSVRGRFRSVPMEKLTEQARILAEGGVKELILVAQETTLYGKDLYGEKRLPQLLKELAKVPGIVWIRLLYCYPEEITDELIAVMKEEPKICHYLDLPIQHSSDRILKAMGRRTTRTEITEKIASMRSQIPDICLRTSLIVGFPGETREDVEDLKSFVKEIGFDRLGCFTYSREEGTIAHDLKPQVLKREKEKRREEVMLLQQEIAFEKGNDRIGEELVAFIEGELPEEMEDGKHCFVARTYRDAPGVDGYIFIHTEQSLMSGDLCRVKVTQTQDYDLIGELL